MNFGVLDFLQLSRRSHNCRLEKVVTRRVRPPASIAEVPCKRYCGFRRCAITPQAVTPADCRECRSHEVLSGIIQDEQGRSFPVVDGVPQFARGIASQGDTRIVEIDFRADPRVDAFVDSCSDGLIFHQPGWMETLSHEYKQECLVLGVEDREGRLKGILPMFYTRGLPFNIGTQQTGRRLACLPRTPMAGPLAVDEASLGTLLQSVIERVRPEHGVQLQLKTAQSLPAVDGLFRTSWRSTYVLSLPETSQQLRFGDARSRHQLKWAVKKAEGLGLRVREAQSETELRQWYRLYLETMRRNVALARPYRFFLAQWKHLRPFGMMKLLLAEQLAGTKSRLVAGSVFLSGGKTVFYAFTGCHAADLGLHPNDLTLWHAIHQACAQGYRHFDFGEVPDEHPELVRFKTKWGAKPIPQYRYYSAAVPARDARVVLNVEPSKAAQRLWIEKMWQSLPLAATSTAADWIYSFL